jgi:hypothetical protein
MFELQQSSTAAALTFKRAAFENTPGLLHALSLAAHMI